METFTPKQISPASVKLYEMWANIYLRQLDGQNPTKESALEFIESMRENGYKQNTIAIARNALHWKFGFDLPSIKIEVPEPKYISVDDVNRLINASPTLLEKTVMILLFSTGCRISEILNLCKKDIEWEQNVITVTRKGGYRQRVAVDERGMEALKEWMRRRQSTSKRVFMDYEYRDIYPRIKKLGKRLGIHVTPHMFRHSRVVQLMQTGIPLERVSDIAGHRNINTTLQMYGRLRAEDLGKYLEQAKW